LNHAHEALQRENPMNEHSDERIQDAAMARIFEHFSDEAPLELQVLKGHLIIEVQLRELFEMQLAHPHALKGSDAPKFDCHQIICLVQAISPPTNQEHWLWPALKTLNSIRNSLAHQLDQKELASKVKSLVKRVNQDVHAHKTMFKSKALQGADQFFAAMLVMSGVLTKLKAIVAAEQRARQAD